MNSEIHQKGEVQFFLNNEKSWLNVYLEKIYAEFGQRYSFQKKLLLKSFKQMISYKKWIILICTEYTKCHESHVFISRRTRAPRHPYVISSQHGL